MTPKEAALRRSPARYWPHTQRDTKPAPDELLRAKRLELERASMDLTSSLCGDPAPSRRQVMHLQRDRLGCYVPAETKD